MGVWFTVDTHHPFRGMDDPEQYTPFIIGRGLDTNEDEDQMVERYETMAQYTDNYLRNIIQSIESSGRETIVVAVGDHGGREAPFVSKGIVDVRDN